MSGAAGLWIVADVRPTRTILATVRADRVIDVRRLDHAGMPEPRALADGIAVLRQRAPGDVVGLAGIWRHVERLGLATPAPLEAVLRAVAAEAGLAMHWLPHGAALALGEWRRRPTNGPLAVLAVDNGLAGGVVVDGHVLEPARLDLGHLLVQPDGAKCPCGARGCLHLYANEAEIYRLVTDLHLPLEAPLADDWQTRMDAQLATLHGAELEATRVATDRAGRAIGLAAAHLADLLGVVEVRVRARHPDVWRVMAPAATEVLQRTSPRWRPALVAADPAEDGFFTGAAHAAIQASATPAMRAA